MNDSPSMIRLPKLTGTHGDIFAAVGLADLLSPPTGRAARVTEESDSFVVSPAQPLSAGVLAELSLAPGYPFVRTGDKVEVPSGAQDPVDYRREKERADQYRQMRNKLLEARKGKLDPDALATLQQWRPRADWRLIQVLNTLQGDENTNRVHREIVSAAPARLRGCVESAALALAMGRPSGLPWKTTSVQLFTPSTAKGYGRLKPDSTRRNDKTKEYWTDPFVEWLKYRGYFRIACPYFVGQKGEHIRILCPVPADITASALSGVAGELRRAGVYGGPAKLDALAVLELATLLIRHSEEYHPADADVFPGLSIQGQTPAQLVSGVSVTHYQSLGSSRAVSSLSVLAVPGWFRVTTPKDAEDWLAILDEHRRVIRGLNHEHSDEVGLLVQYRRFLERRGTTALDALLDFMDAYGPFLLRATAQGRRVRAFQTDNLRRIIMGLNPTYSQILDDPGFQAVAAAVRRATVSAQFQKAAGRKDYREIRYDLLPELRRKRALPDSRPFIEVVSEFVAAFNIENARRREMKKVAPRNVTTEQFAAFCRSVEDHGAAVVGALLCAYGSCREPRDQTDQGQATGEPEEQEPLAVGSQSDDEAAGLGEE